MYYFMRTLYSTLLLFVLTNTFGQVIIDTTLQRQYTKAFDTLPNWLQQKTIEAEKDTLFKGGFVILIELRIDTLNKEELKKSSGRITITDITTINGKKEKSNANDLVIESENGYDLLFCGGKFDLDTFIINIGAPFSYETIQQKIIKSVIQTTYNEIHGGDTIFWSDRSHIKTRDLTIAARTVRMVLSSADYKSGKTLYGYSEIETEPYYMETFGFEKGYIKKRLCFKYYFKLKSNKNNT